MFDGDNYLNFCGILEKLISLMRKIACFFAIFLGICMPLMSFAFFVVITEKEEIKSDYSGFYCNRSEPQCMFQFQLFFIWGLTYGFIFCSHIVDLFVTTEFNNIVERKMNSIVEVEDLKKIWPMFNLILILPLIAVQAYVSYIVHNLIFVLCSTCNYCCLVKN